MAAHRNQVVVSHINLLLSGTGLGHVHFLWIRCRTARLATPLSHVCSTAWWAFSPFSFTFGGGLQVCLFYVVPFWKSQHSSSFWKSPRFLGIAEWLRWERPYEDHLVLPPRVFSFEAQCRCSKSTEKWGCKTVMIAAYLTTPPVFPVG